jgi:diadenosine tetraphosphate (Ap4A) HIT family hydrolase
MPFEIHPMLQRDCVELGRFPLCRLLLMNDGNFPWFVLVPERPDITEIYQLTDQDQMQLIRESSHLARVLAENFNADKMNVAALGNMVPQLHIHHIVRHRTDPAWPGPIWGKAERALYSEDALEHVTERVTSVLTTPGLLPYKSLI